MVSADNITDKAINSVKTNITQIENRTDITDDEKINQIIKIFSAVCAGVAVQPIPFADIFILTPIQAYMGSRIAAIRGVPLTHDGIYGIVKKIGGVVGLGLLAQQLIIGGYKFIPYLGIVTTIPMVFGMTYAMGYVMDAYFEKMSRGENLSDEQIKDIWKKAKEKGIAIGKTKAKDINEKAGKDNEEK